MTPPTIWNRVFDFLKSSPGHKLVGGLLGAASTYLLTGHVDIPTVLAFLGFHP